MLAGKKIISLQDAFALLNCHRLPARLNTSEVAVLLGFQGHDIAPLVAAKLLTPLGKPAPNAPKYFAAIEVLSCAQDRVWLSNTTRAISRHWTKKNHSHKGFVCDNTLEREADHFASALLIPERVLKERCGRRGWMDIDGILKLAQDCVTSATSAALRYAKFAEEACVAILSRSGTRQVICAIPSQEAQARGLSWVEQVPLSSTTAKCVASAVSSRPLSEETSSDLWFRSYRAATPLWEEAYPLRMTNLVLTLLSYNK